MKALIAVPALPSYLDRYMAIRDKKQHATRRPLIAAHALLMQRYQDHALAIAQGTLAGLAKNSQAIALSEPLRACYDGATKPLKTLKDDIRSAQPQRQLKYCPMCGTTLPKTYDHYLPAVAFPEFAVHALNLVPCCALCNSMKDDDWLSAAGERQYLHAYADILPDVQFVHVTLHEHPSFAWRRGDVLPASASRRSRGPTAPHRIALPAPQAARPLQRIGQRRNRRDPRGLQDISRSRRSSGADVPPRTRYRQSLRAWTEPLDGCFDECLGGARKSSALDRCCLSHDSN